MEYSAVVKVFATSQAPDFSCPWQSLSPSGGTGSGVAIDDGRVLTGAHVVANATFVQVQKSSSTQKYTAQVEAICHDSDLAVVRVLDEDFMDGIQPAEVGDLPKLRDRVSVVGYPIGGEEVSITEGVVSRIEVQEYSHSQRNLLAITVDAAINEGNSGGPVFKDGEVVGLAFQVLRNAESIGEVVPTPLIRQFLHAIDKKIETVVPGLGIRIQKLESQSLRTHVGLTDEQSGVMVTEVAHNNSCHGQLVAGDVITSVDGHPIENNGTIRYRGEFRTEYPIVLGDHHCGDDLSFEILREREKLTVEVPLQPYRLLVPLDQYETDPTYFIYGGFVFQTLSRDFLRCWDEWWDRAPKEFLYQYYFGLPTPQRTEIVIISRVLAHEINVGYEDTYNLAIVKLNGKQPTDIYDFVSRLHATKGTVELETSTGFKVILNSEDAKKANEEILIRYNIRSGHSVDLDKLLAS
jgi:S1-C subfamily serine protease